MTIEDAYNLVIVRLGFVVICWKPDSDRQAYNHGNPVLTIWGDDYRPPDRLVCAGTATTAEWNRQQRILHEAGLPNTKRPSGWKISKVVKAGDLKTNPPRFKVLAGGKAK